MEAVKKAALKKAMVYLNSVGVDYFIRIPDGEDIVKGDLTIAIKETRKRIRKFPQGTFTRLYRSLKVDRMEVGDVMTIPFGEYGKHQIQSTLTAFAAMTWGSGSYTTCLNGDSIEIMRLTKD